MPRKYPYSPSFDGKKSQPGTLKLVDLCRRRWKTTNLGVYVNRPMRNPAANGALSVHATGAAADIGYAKRSTGVAMWDWFIKYTKELGIVEMHDYAFGKYGRGYRCSRGEGEAGVKVFISEADSAGSIGGKWLHIELDPVMAKDAVKFETAWRGLPKP